MKNNGIRCAVCGEKKSQFGDGMKIPKTTCLDCHVACIKQNKIDKKLEKQKSKEL